MPKKIRELKAMLREAGFVNLPKRGKGSHSIWQHPLLTIDVRLPGNDGSDAKPYLEKQVKEALDLLKRLENEEGAE